ncbi:hypothetical protein D3C84_1110170 [compost metagenome]
MRKIATGSTRTPPLAMTEKAEAIWSGLTGKVPNAREGTGLIGLVMPSLRAVSMTRSAPTVIIVLTAYILSELAMAVRISIKSLKYLSL